MKKHKYTHSELEMKQVSHLSQVSPVIPQTISMFFDTCDIWKQGGKNNNVFSPYFQREFSQ